MQNFEACMVSKIIQNFGSIKKLNHATYNIYIYGVKQIYHDHAISY